MCEAARGEAKLRCKIATHRGRRSIDTTFDTTRKDGPPREADTDAFPADGRRHSEVEEGASFVHHFPIYRPRFVV